MATGKLITRDWDTSVSPHTQQLGPCRPDIGATVPARARQGFAAAAAAAISIGYVIGLLAPARASAQAPSAPDTSTAPGDTSLPSREFMVAIGDYQLLVRVVGDPTTGTPILAIPGGLSLSHEYLAPLERLATEDRAFVTFDVGGSGRSTVPGPGSTRTLADVSAEIEAVRRAVKAESLILMPHSMASLNAIDYVSRHPARVFAAIIIEPAPPTFAGLNEAMDTMTKRLGELVTEGSIAPFPPSAGANCTAFIRIFAPVWYANPKDRNALNQHGVTCMEDRARLRDLGQYDLTDTLRKIREEFKGRVLIYRSMNSPFKDMAESTIAAFGGSPQRKVSEAPTNGSGPRDNPQLLVHRQDGCGHVPFNEDGLARRSVTCSSEFFETARAFLDSLPRTRRH